MGINYYGTNQDNLNSLLAIHLSTPFQIPYLQLSRADHVSVIGDDRGCLCVASNSLVTQVSNPLGKFDPEFVHSAFVYGLFTPTIVLDGWENNLDLRICLDVLLESTSIEAATHQEQVMLYQDPSSFPRNLTGKHFQSLRTALNKQSKRNLYVRKLDDSDLSEIVDVAKNWCHIKFPSHDITHNPLYQEAIGTFSPPYEQAGIEAFGIFSAEDRLLAFQSFLQFGGYIVPLAQMGIPNKDSAQECLEIHMLRYWQSLEGRLIFRGEKLSQTESIPKYYSKFAPLLELPRVRLVLS